MMSSLDDEGPQLLDPHVSVDLTYLQKQLDLQNDEDDEDDVPSDDDPMDESQDTVADIDDLNRRLGDTLLENIHLKHEKRQSIAMAERWKSQAEKLQRKIAKTQNKLSKLSAQGVPVDVDEDDDADDIYDTEKEKLRQKISELSKQVESLQLEYGDEVLTNIKLRREKRESVMLLEKEKGQADQLRRALSTREEAINNLTKVSLNSRLTTGAGEFEDEMTVEEMSRMQLQLAHRQSLAQIANYKEQTLALQQELKEKKDTTELEEQMRDLNLQLGDEVLANIRLKREKRQSVMVAKTYQTQLTDLQKEVVELQSENRRLVASKMQSITNLTQALNDSRSVILSLARRLEKYEPS